MANNKNIKINLDYSQFSGGISECQRKMSILTEEFKMQQSALGNNASEVDKLTLSQSTLSQKIQLQMQIVEQAAARFNALSESEDATTAQVDNAQKAYIKQITKLNELTNELSEVNNKLEESAQAEEEMSASSNNASQSNQTLAASITATVAVITTMVAAVKEVASAIMDVATKSTEWADDLATLSSQMGVSTTTLQEWGYAASFVDVSLETMQGSLSKLTKEMGEAQNGSTSAQSAFDRLGVSITNADGSLRSAEEVFYDVIDALGNIDNVAERDAASMELFGKSAQDLNTLIDAGSSALRAYGAEAEALGVVMSESDVQALAQMQDSFDQLNAVMDAAQNRVSAAFAPAISAIANAIANLNPQFLEVIAGAGMFLGLLSSLAPLMQAAAGITQLWTVAKIASAGATAVQTGAELGLGAAAMATNAALLPQIAIFGLLAAAVIGLIELIKSLVELFQLESELADKAAESTNNFANAASGTSRSDGSDTSSSGRGHYALGGRVSGKQVWVGEQGAELVELPSGSTVYNHQESRNMTSSNNVFNVTIDAHNVDDFNKVVKVFSGLSQSMSRGGRVNG